MDSIPPATTQSFKPNPIPIDAYTIDLIPELQTLLIVVQGTFYPIPAFNDACLAGF